MLNGYAKRSTLWSVLFYGLCIAALFVLRGKSEPKNGEILFIFVPLLILGISSESMSKIVFKCLKPYNVIDFCVKLSAFAMLQLPYVVKDANEHLILRIVFISVAFAVSLAMDILMTVRRGNFKTADFAVGVNPKSVDMSLKDLQKLAIYCALGSFCPVLGGFLCLFFGYTVAFFIIGLPLTALGAVMLAMRTVAIIKRGRALAGLPKAIIDVVLMTAVIIFSMIFTTGKIVETDGGFTVTQSYSTLAIVCFSALYLTAFISCSITNQKVGTLLLRIRSCEKELL